MKNFTPIKINPVDIDLFDINRFNVMDDVLSRRTPFSKSKIVVMNTPESRAGVRNIYREYAERDFGFHEKSIDDETLEKLHEIARQTAYLYDEVLNDYVRYIRNKITPIISEVRELIIEEMKKQQS